MLPKKIYLNYIEEDDKDKTWSEQPVSVADCEMQNREYTDLSQVWHDVSERPIKFSTILVLFPIGKITTWASFSDIMKQFNDHNVIKWAYIDDLLPKGGKV